MPRSLEITAEGFSCPSHGFSSDGLYLRKPAIQADAELFLCNGQTLHVKAKTYSEGTINENQFTAYSYCSGAYKVRGAGSDYDPGLSTPTPAVHYASVHGGGDGATPGLKVEAGRMRVIGPSGSVVLDTNERPALLTNFFAGKIEYPFRFAPVRAVTENVVGTCEAGSLFSFAMISKQSNADTVTLWANMNGTITNNGPGGITRYIGHSVLITGTSVSIIEDALVPVIRQPNGQILSDLGAYKIKYKIWVGRFH